MGIFVVGWTRRVGATGADSGLAFGQHRATAGFPFDPSHQTGGLVRVGTLLVEGAGMDQHA